MKAIGPSTGGTDVRADGAIRSERRGPVLLLGIDRPAKRNGFTPEMAHALAEGYTLLEGDPELRGEPARLAASADAHQGLAAFRERRAPRFSGR